MGAVDEEVLHCPFFGRQCGDAEQGEMAVGRQDAQGLAHIGRWKSGLRQLRVEAGDARGWAMSKAMLKRAPQEVVADALMGALVSSGKESSSSLRNTKGSSITKLGKRMAAAARGLQKRRSGVLFLGSRDQ